MQKYIYLYLLCTPIFLNAQSKKEDSLIILDEVYIVPKYEYLEKVNVVNFEHYNVYVFPKEYGEQYFRKIKKKYKECIDIDTSLIRAIDKELVNQYFLTNKRFMEIRFEESWARKKTDPNAHDWKLLKKQQKEYWKKFNANKHIYTERVKYCQRQFIGYINENEEQIILINLIDLREDTNDLKKHLNKLDDWRFSEKFRRVHYHIDSRKLTINEDF